MNKEVLKKNFEAHRFQTQFFQTKEEAAEYLKSEIHGKTVGFGGSITAKEMGLDKIYVKDESYRFGLNAFKVLGGSFAIGNYLARKLNKSIAR